MLFNHKELANKSRANSLDNLSEIFISKYLTTHFEKVSSLNDDLVRLPSENEFFFLQSVAAFNAFTFITLVAKVFPVKHLYVSTYSISKEVIDALIELHDIGRIEGVTILVSTDMINQTSVLQMAKSRANINILYASVKAKICLLETHQNHYVIEGSGNWNENAQFEQYLFAFSKSLFDFRLQLFTNVKLKKY
jgi:hypothetical protein